MPLYVTEKRIARNKVISFSFPESSHSHCHHCTTTTATTTAIIVITFFFSAPIARIFWLDEALCSSIYLDGVVAVVDAKYGLQHCREQKPAGEINEAIRWEIYEFSYSLISPLSLFFFFFFFHFVANLSLLLLILLCCIRERGSSDAATKQNIYKFQTFVGK